MVTMDAGYSVPRWSRKASGVGRQGPIVNWPDNG